MKYSVITVVAILALSTLSWGVSAQIRDPCNRIGCGRGRCVAPADRPMVAPLALGGSGAINNVEENPRNVDNANNSSAAHDKPKYDVKGKAKGQGQNADVVRNRNFKTAHKARGANHNRKAGARSKMSKGMF